MHRQTGTDDGLFVHIVQNTWEYLLKTKVAVTQPNPTIPCTSTSPSGEGILWLVGVQPCSFPPHYVAGSGVSGTLVLAHVHAQALYLLLDV